jgi:hypothetical protein
MIKISNKPRHLRYLGFSEYIVPKELWDELQCLFDKTHDDFYSSFYVSHYETKLFIRNPKIELVLKLKFGDKIYEVEHFGKRKKLC